MPWPAPQDYNEAVQNPWLNLRDRILMAGKVELNAMGLPKPMTGAFASVYRINCEDRTFAIKLFLRQIADQQARYAQLSVSMSSQDLPYIVGFEYQPTGILVHGTWYPILKMEWAQGDNLDRYVVQHVNDAASMSTLCERFSLMMKNLGGSGIAHGDLQHGNILVKNGRFKLVDYDGMFVSQLKKFRSNELGHPNYQHPGRGPQHFGAYLDNFSAWVIHSSLLALSLDPKLWQELSGGEECLLFREDDFQQPDQSRAFNLLGNHTSDQIRTSARILRALLTLPIEQVPPLNEKITDVSQLSPLACTQGETDAPPAALATPEIAAGSAGKKTGGSRGKGSRGKGSRGKGSRGKAASRQTMAASEKTATTPTIETQSTQSTGLPSWLVHQTKYIREEKPQINTSKQWPRYEEYRQAVSNPKACFLDPELREACLINESKGWGANGAVFHLRCRHRHVAVKCFFKNIPGRQERFRHIHGSIAGEAKQYFVDFEYLNQGIRVGQYWYPILKMEWIEPTLDDFIANNLKFNQARLAVLPDRFRSMIIMLQRAGIAHGDLEPSNLVVVNNDFKLIDYDGMYVPAMKGLPGIESGNPGFQHPDRTVRDFGPHLDNFSAWILDAELFYLQIDPQLWTLAETRAQIASGKRSDWAFDFLDVHPSKQVRNTGDILRKLLDYDFHEIPYFDRKSPLYTLRESAQAKKGWRGDMNGYSGYWQS